MSLLAMVENKCQETDLVVLHGSVLDYGIRLIGAWRLREGIPFLLRHIDLRYEDFRDGPQRGLETRPTDDFFPCVTVLSWFREDAVVPVMDYAVLRHADGEKGKLAIVALMRALGKDRAISRLRAYLTAEEEEELSGLLEFAESWNGAWRLNPPESHRKQ